MASSGTDHTIVPPPFYASNVEVFMKSEPSSTGSEAGSNRVPPLPPIKDLTLLSAPFTHTSTLAAYITPSNTNTYEPLEFLGDAYLEIIATRLIHNFFPSHTVGQKSGLREILIRNDTLFQYAKDYGFGDRVQVSGIDPSQRAWIKVLADVFEAYVACVILSDNQYGFQTAETWLAALWQPKIREWRKFGDGKNPAPSGVISMDVKSELQRMTVSKGVKLEYLEEKPMEHIKEGNRTTFFMGVYISGWDYNKRKLGSGSGKNKQLASAEAAKDAFISGRAIVERAHQMKLAFDQQNVQIAKLNGKANGKRTR
jgi:ribonuclease-3